MKELIEELHLEGSEVFAVLGNTKIEKERMLNKPVIAFKSWGKHFLICFKDFSLRIHFMLFGSYRINERRDIPVRLGLIFENAELNFYNCSLKFIEEDLDQVYDWSADVLSKQWNPEAAAIKLEQKKDALVCDVLLDQQIFAGVGNIIKNEVLYRIGVHPLSTVGALPFAKLQALIQQARMYSFDFLKWKKEYTLRKHWMVHTKKLCPLEHPIKRAHLGKTNRRSFFCIQCQNLYIDKK
ncbi:MAG TPA: endonuclease [Daejeonella sp.]|nr:endonuclease [Daejeonella sp.]